MNDKEALLRAIWDEPEDDARRLGYADWLDEQPATYKPCGYCKGLGAVKIPNLGAGKAKCPKCNETGEILDDHNLRHADLIRRQIDGRFPAVEFAHSASGKWNLEDFNLEPPSAVSLFADLLGPVPKWWPLNDDNRIIFRRGFPDELQCPTSWLIKRCDTCNGDDIYEGGYHSTSAGTHYYCEVCGNGRSAGSGYVRGDAIELFRFPLTRVVLTDKWPEDDCDFNRRDEWVWSRAANGAEEESTLPDAVFWLLEGHLPDRVQNDEQEWRDYPTEQTASNAAAQAAAKLGRQMWQNARADAVRAAGSAIRRS